MSCQTWQLDELEVEPLEIREVLRCIVHTIMFHRVLGLVRPKDTDSELFEITYVKCGDEELERKIEEKIDQLIVWIEKHPNKKISVCLSFFEIKNKQTKWFNKTDRVYWEHWYINLQLVKSRTITTFHLIEQTTKLEEASSKHAALESALREVMFQIVRFANEKSNHVPSVPSSHDSVSFPFDITIPSLSDFSFGWSADVFKRMLQTGHPNLLN
ncbi:autophagy-related protein 101-like [Dioscorea cayenensis subsp. rotundata]|uniref:Autophagy-related protein 101 n=1 Tax=Dioscorea cayennensis subsp. rotundata TaxID=55577 RepID=A0AB40APP8_DIOCR|nr:autophagy-related protein 101-like [Dioscorea cayenensis subsp. rotundata]